MSTPQKQNYEAWRVNDKLFPSASSSRDQMLFILNYAVLAPSTHNTQPWKFEFLSDTTLRISPDFSRELPQADRTRAALYFSLGCLLLNLRVAADHFGMDTNIEVGEGESTERINIDVHYGKKPSNRESAWPTSLFPAITQRRSHKVPFASKALPKELLSQIGGVHYGGASVVIRADQESKQKLVALHFRATMMFAKNSKFSKEVSSWMRGNGTNKKDGMPGFTFGLPAPIALVAKMMTTLTPSSVSVVAKNDKAAIGQSGAVGVVVTDGDSIADWINAGQTYQHAGLLATASDAAFAPKAASIQAGLGAELMSIFEGEGHPQLYFAAGYGDGVVRHTPRRPIHEVIKVVK